jgi:hypothetical protein
LVTLSDTNGLPAIAAATKFCQGERSQGLAVVKFDQGERSQGLGVMQLHHHERCSGRPGGHYSGQGAGW